MSTLKELNEMTTEDVLRMARADIGRNWIQGSLATADGQRCALGAISSVLDLMTSNGGVTYPAEYRPKTDKQKRMRKLAMAASEQLYKALPKKAQTTDEGNHTDNIVDAIINYNDADGRHHRTITKWFDRAVAISAK